MNCRIFNLVLDVKPKGRQDCKFDLPRRTSPKEIYKLAAKIVFLLQGLRTIILIKCEKKIGLLKK